MKVEELLQSMASLYFLAWLFSLVSADYLHRHERDAQAQSYENPRFGNDSIRFCAFNQYLDEQEGRCVIVPGGGSVITIDHDARCEYEVLRPHPTLPRTYYVCRRTKTILARCNSGQRFDDRLKRCAVDVNSTASDLSDSENVPEAYDTVRPSATERPPQFRRFRLLRRIFVCPLINQFDPVLRRCFRWLGCDNYSEEKIEPSTIRPEPKSVTSNSQEHATKATPRAFTGVTRSSKDLQEITTPSAVKEIRKFMPIAPNVVTVTDKNYENVALRTTRGSIVESSTAAGTTESSNKNNKAEVTAVEDFTTNKPNTEKTVPTNLSQGTSQPETIITTKKWLFDFTPTATISTTKAPKSANVAEETFVTPSTLLTTAEFVATSESGIVENTKTTGVVIPLTSLPEAKSTKATFDEVSPNDLLTTETTTSDILGSSIENIVTTNEEEFLTSVDSTTVRSGIGEPEPTPIVEESFKGLISSTSSSSSSSSSSYSSSNSSSTRSNSFGRNSDAGDGKTDIVDSTTIPLTTGDSETTSIATESVEDVTASTNSESSSSSNSFGRSTDAADDKTGSADSVLSAIGRWETTTSNIFESPIEDVLTTRIADNTNEEESSTSESTTENSSFSTDAGDGKTKNVDLITVLSTIDESETKSFAEKSVKDLLTSTSSSSSSSSSSDASSAVSFYTTSVLLTSLPPSSEQMEYNATTVDYDETTTASISRSDDETSGSFENEPNTSRTIEKMSILREDEFTTPTSIEETSILPKHESITPTSIEETSILPEHESITPTSIEKTSILPEDETTTSISIEQTSILPEHESITPTSIEETSILREDESTTTTSIEETSILREDESTTSISIEETSILPEREPTTRRFTEETSISSENESTISTYAEQTSILPDNEPATGTPAEETPILPENEHSTRRYDEETSILPENDPTTRRFVEETSISPENESTNRRSTEDTSISSENESTISTYAEQTSILPDNEPTTGTPAEETPILPENEHSTHRYDEETSISPENELTTRRSTEETSNSPENEPSTRRYDEEISILPENDPSTRRFVEETSISPENESTTMSNDSETEKATTTSYASIPFVELPMSTTEASSKVTANDLANTSSSYASITPTDDSATTTTEATYPSSESPEETIVYAETRSNTQSTTDGSTHFPD